VAGRLDENVRAAAENVRKQGAKLRKDPKGFMDDMVRDGRSLGRKLTKRAEGVRHRRVGARRAGSRTT